MPKFVKGGRGKVAPYVTTHCRVPEPIKHLVDEMTAIYKNALDSNEDPHGNALINAIESFLHIVSMTNFLTYHPNAYSEKPSSLLSCDIPVNKFNRDDLIALSKNVLNHKKSARLSILKLLQELYPDISENDLH